MGGQTPVVRGGGRLCSPGPRTTTSSTSRRPHPHPPHHGNKHKGPGRSLAPALQTSDFELQTSYWKVYRKLSIMMYTSAFDGLLSEAVVWNVWLINSVPDTPVTVASR